MGQVEEQAPPIEGASDEPDKAGDKANKDKDKDKNDKDKKKEQADPLANVSDVFSFAKTIGNKLCIMFGILFAACTGCTFPAMAWIFASSFEKLSSVGVEG